MKLIWLIALAVIVWKLVTGRWPWQPKSREPRSFSRAQHLAHARALLGVREGASRKEIIEAHRRLLSEVHPDRGGSSEKVHEANAARDALLSEPSPQSQEPR